MRASQALMGVSPFIRLRVLTVVQTPIHPLHSFYTTTLMPPVLIVNDSRLFEDGKGAHAMVIRLWLRHREWKHVLIYDDSNRRVQVMKYADGHAVP